VWAIGIGVAFLMYGRVWGRYWTVQCAMVTAMLVGVVFLPFPCLFQAWKRAPSTVGPAAMTDRWTWPINAVYGNPSADGVSGTFAMIWRGAQHVPYMPTSWPPWRAYCWNMRNSAGGLKYNRWTVWEEGPLVQGVWLKSRREWKLGWQRENGIKVAVFSL